MSKIHEYKGKEFLKLARIEVPEGYVAQTPEEAGEKAKELGGEVVIKGQAWTTARLARGLIKFAKTPEEAVDVAKGILGQKIEGFPLDTVLVEKKLEIEKEFYAGFIIDDSVKKPMMIFSSKGGTGIEEIAEKYPENLATQHVNVREGLLDFQARDMVRRAGIKGKLQLKLSTILQRLYDFAWKSDARSAEINPLVILKDGRIVAADCRITVDDYAVYRHKEFGIDFARELGRPPTELDRIAYQVEKNDYRGTFYFVQMHTGFKKDEGYIAFHGAGGGGSMMSMDSLTKHGYKMANFTDTSGNPPASKVYRAAKIILSQKNIDGYFGSGSGVASQEQFHSARGLVKAFLEDGITIPVVIRLGGNQEDKAVAILTEYTKELPVAVEGYKKDDSPDYCVQRLQLLLNKTKTEKIMPYEPVEMETAKEPYSWKTVTGGEVIIDHAKCDGCESKICASECAAGILEIKEGRPYLNISKEEAEKGKCIECLACEIDCRFKGAFATKISLPIRGLLEYRKGESK
ncbi:ATP-grasp domain-containing protein [Candidatus Riflebacteria bacterium]